MKTKMTIDELTDAILNCEKDMESLKNKDLSKFSKKYLDYLELKELEYNISNYAS
jgi:hypothetical protein